MRQGGHGNEQATAKGAKMNTENNKMIRLHRATVNCLKLPKAT